MDQRTEFLGLFKKCYHISIKTFSGSSMMSVSQCNVCVSLVSLKTFVYIQDILWFYRIIDGIVIATPTRLNFRWSIHEKGYVNNFSPGIVTMERRIIKNCVEWKQNLWQTWSTLYVMINQPPRPLLHPSLDSMATALLCVIAFKAFYF